MALLLRYSNRAGLLVDLGYAARQIARGLAKPQPRRSVGSPDRISQKRALQDRFTLEELGNIIQDRINGLSQGKTAKKYGISESSVKRLVRIHKAGARAVDLAVTGQHQSAG
ncbi:hypothetical protein Psuf_014220 [Phytohabitans suffuscus]|uniref:HTH psq-type domain-containing protein n=1 Tax=Phytohabitans suffuscus TaxID=624315 RepID=A0A6F8YDL3_9ACTN|nr:hypothetical protein Psuf_014220 [Phytohabitans suffuscus]